MSGFAPSLRRHRLALWAASLLIVLTPVSFSHSEDAPRDGALGDHRIRRALDVLSHVPTGKVLLARAQAFWKLPRPHDLLVHLRWGKASKTDAVLTRHFNPRTGVESRERQVTIYLREGQALEDLVLDVAHELVHATSRPGWDPYDPKLTPGRYIWAAIEGDGGEVPALATECRVGFEIQDRYGAASAAAQRCRSYVRRANEGPDPDLIRRDFYRIGKWSQELVQNLGLEKAMFPLLSPESPTLYSSTGNAPYPVALFREFEEITRIACENSRRRAQTEVERSPAALQRNAATFVAQRCDRLR